MLEEAVEVMRAAVDRRHRRPPRRLLRGRERPPVRPARRRPIPVIVSGFGTRPPSSPPGSATATGATAPDAELVDAFETAGGTGPRYAQLNVCWAEDEDDAQADRARDVAQRRRPGPAVTGPPDVDALRAGGEPSPRSRSTKSVTVRPRHPDELREERRASTSTPATTTSTSTRSAPTRTGSSASGSDELRDAVANYN